MLRPIEFYRGSALMTLGRFEEAEVELRGFISHPEEAKTFGASFRISVLQTLGALMISKGEFNQALEFYSQGLTAARDAGYLETELSILSALGALAAMQSEFELAGKLYEEALNLALQSEKPAVQAGAYVNLGLWAMMAHQQRDTARSREYLERALHLFQDAKDFSGQSYTLGHLINNALIQGDLPMTQAYLAEAQRLARKARNDQLQVPALEAIARWSFFARDFGTAKEYALQLLAIRSESQHPVDRADALIFLSRIDDRLDSTEEALKNAREASDLYSKNGNRLGMAVTWLHLGSLFLQLGNQSASIEQVRHFVELYHDMKTETTAVGVWFDYALVCT